MPDDSSTSTDLNSILDAIELLDEQALLKLNEVIADRITHIRAEAHRIAIAQFKPGDEVQFTDKSGSLVSGFVIKINKKTVGVMNQAGQRWNVSPQLLSFAERNTNANDADDIIEWVGGIVSLPAQVQEDGETPAYQPEAILWLDNERFVVGFEIFEPGEAIKDIAVSLSETILKPKAGSRMPPQRVRVSTEEVQNALADEFPELNIVVGATPELDEVMNSMAEHLSEQGQLESLSYLSAGLPPAAIEAFFEATAKLYALAPWKIVPSDAFLIGVSIPAHNLEHAVLTIIGQEETNYGFVLFDSLDRYRQYMSFIDSIEMGLAVQLPEHRSVNFIPATQLDKHSRKQIASNQWTVANTKAYPDLFLPVSDRQLRVATVEDLDLIEGLCRALALALQNPKPWKQAWTDFKEVSRRFSLATFKGAMEVELTAPYPYQRAAENRYPPDSLMYPLHRLVELDDDFDEEPYEHFEALNAAFLESPEGKPFQSSITLNDVIQTFAYNYFSTSVAHLGVVEFDEIMFDIVPRKVSIGSEDAKTVIESTRAFFRYLQREYSVVSAEACLALLDDNAERRLSEALSNPANFGVGKSLLAHMRDSGFDPSTQEGIDAWMAESGGKLPDHIKTPQDRSGMFLDGPGMLPDYMEPPPRAIPTKKVDQKARKQKRKQARKARKRNK